MLMCMLTGGNIDLSCGAFVCLLGAFGGVFMIVKGMGVGVSILNIPAAEQDLPQATEGRLHGDAAFANAQLHTLSQLGQVLQLDIDCHSPGFVSNKVSHLRRIDKISYFCICYS